MKRDMSIANGETLRSSYPPSVAWDMDIEQISLTDMFSRAVKKYANHPCIDFYGRELSFRDMEQLVDRAAAGFQSMGVTKGTRVGLYMPNTPWHPVLFFGALKAGAIIVNFNPMAKLPQLQKQIQDSGTEILISADMPECQRNGVKLLKQGELKKFVLFHLHDTMPADKSALSTRHKIGLPVYKVLSKLMCLFNISVYGRIQTIDKLMNKAGHFTPVPVAPEDTAVLQYTGGTTGLPKAAELTHANLTANVQQIEAFFGHKDGRNADDLTLHHGKTSLFGPLPNFHIFGMTTTMLLPIHMGMKTVMALDPKDIEGNLKNIERSKADFAAAVPLQVQKALSNKAINRYDHSSLRGIVTGGAATPPSLHETVSKHCTSRVFEGYGLSETSPVLTANPPENVKVGYAGLPLPGVEIRICHIDNPEAVLPRGETGEIQTRGPNLMKGYWQRPEENKNVFTKDGWFKTGDVGHLTDEGFLKITDRLKRMINVGGTGKKVWANIIENEILRHENIAECVVVTVHKGTPKEAAKAFIRVKDGKEADDASVRKHLRAYLSDLEIPRYIEFVNTPLPVTAISKPDWKKLEDMEAAKEKQINKQTLQPK